MMGTGLLVTTDGLGMCCLDVEKARGRGEQGNSKGAGERFQQELGCKVCCGGALQQQGRQA
jgi:hypothetical protein